MKNNTKKNSTKKIHKKKGGTGTLIDELNNYKKQNKKNLKQKKIDKIDKYLSNEDTILINPNKLETISHKSLLRVLTNYDDKQVDNLTEKDLYDAYIIWSNKEAAALQRNRTLKRGKKSGKDETPPKRKRKSKSSIESIEKEELVEAAKHAAEEQKKIDDMNTYGTLYYPTPRSPTRTMVIDDYPHGFTPHGTKRQRKNSLSMTTPQDLFVNQEISEEPYDIDSLFNSSDMPSPLIPTPDI